MKKINNLNELMDLIGSDATNDCFKKKFMEIIAQAKKQQDLDDNCTIMDDKEMNEYIDNVSRAELYDELRHNNPRPYPKYLKAIRVSLVEQGYDQHWVESEFRDALEDRYLKIK